MNQAHGGIDGEARVDARVTPEGALEVLSQAEVQALVDGSRGGLGELVRRCALAVLNSGSAVDDARSVFERHRDFALAIHRRPFGIELELRNAPAAAFVDGELIRGMREHLFAVLRDILYVTEQIERSGLFDLTRPDGVTDAVFNILRHAGLLAYSGRPLVVCWGGHAVSGAEYDYSKEVGYELGLRALDVCTGCGPGAMKGPMKGAAIGLAKQRLDGARFVGVTEPGIIAAEPPNPIVNRLVIMPDMEKRLEAFVRLAHAIVIFPGGVGTAEELLYLLAALLDPANAGVPLPVVLTGPADSAGYWQRVGEFVERTLGREAWQRVRVLPGAPEAVARHVREGAHAYLDWRRSAGDTDYFNWLLRVAPALQQPFVPTHEAMAALRLDRSRPAHELAVDLRRAFTGIVAGNVKEDGIRAVEAHGPFTLHGEPEVIEALDGLLSGFVAEGRMRLGGRPYTPVWRLVPGAA